LFIEVARALAAHDRKRFLRDLSPGARVLEVGCGDGRFLAFLRHAGFTPTGIEASPARAALARAQGLRVEAVPVEKADVPAASCEAVLFWHALEHLDEPDHALVLARRWLRSGGRLVIAVPNLDSLQARLGRDHWFHQDVPRHLTHFTFRGLVALLERSGFEVLRSRHVLLEHNVFGMWQTLLNLVTAEQDVVYRFLKRSARYDSRRTAMRDALTVTILGLPLLGVAVALEIGAGLAGRGGTIAVEALRT
jgi:SAM-dependent methyltransferase